LQKELTRVGFARVYDVAEGLIGGWNAGPGWLKRGLPLRPGNKATEPPVTNWTTKPSL
jgi:hypothetical protein